jgi:HEAT repeat protein
LRAPKSLETVLPLIHLGQDPVVLGFAIDAVAKVGTWRNEGELTPYLSHPDLRIRDVAARTLGEIGNDDVVGELFTRLDREGQPQVRRTLTLAIGRIGSPFAVRQLELMLEDGHSPERQQLALEAFESMGLSGGQTLRTLLDDPDKPKLRGWIRTQAESAVAKLEGR